jgi:hypothetical protein
MSFEGRLTAVLRAAIDNATGPTRVFPDAVIGTPVRPYVTYQQVGGGAIAFLEAGVPGQKNARMQIMVFGENRIEVNRVARRIEDALIADEDLCGEPLGALVAIPYQSTAKLYGTRQDFGFWFVDGPVET